MAEAAMHLVDHVLPYVPYRQFVISFPIPMRFWLQSNRSLYAKVHALAIGEIHRYYKQKAGGQGISESTPGSISFTQRFGSALNLNPHMHVLCPEGVWTKTKQGAKFHPLPAIDDDEVALLITRVSQAIMRMLKRKGYLDKGGDIVQNPLGDTLYQDCESVALATQCSISGKIAFGPNAGKYVTRIGSGFGYGEEIPLAKGNRCFSINGFSMHAATAVKTHQRDRLRKLIEYIARGPLSNERIEIIEDGGEQKVKLQLKTKWSDGTTHLLFTPSEFVEKLVALIPPPRSHLVRWAGVFAPNSPFRKEITLKPEIKKGMDFKGGEDNGIKNYRWAKMLAQVFKIDVEKCQLCGGKMKALGAVKDQGQIIRYLKHIGLPTDPPQRAPPATQQDDLCFDQSQGGYPDQETTIYLD